MGVPPACPSATTVTMNGIAPAITAFPDSTHPNSRRFHHHTGASAHVSVASRQPHQQCDAQPQFDPVDQTVRLIHAVLLLLRKLKIARALAIPPGAIGRPVASSRRPWPFPTYDKRPRP